MRLLPHARLPKRLLASLLLIAVVIAIGLTLWSHQDGTPLPQRVETTETTSAAAGPPWLYGKADARFTIVEYADLECPFCQSHVPMLRRWIDANPEVNLQWHHLPLSMHEPAATRQARLAECAGETGGHAAFWDAIGWIYQHTRGDGQGIPDDLQFPGTTPALRSCLDSTRPEGIVQVQAAEAAQQGIAATPTLRLRDRDTGKTLVLHGPVEGDALLSALDLLATPETGTPATPDANGTPAHAADTPVR